MAAIAGLPTFDARLREIAAAEQCDGWLAACIDEDRYLLPSREFVAALAECLAALGDDALRLEVCAGRGELAEALAQCGVSVVAVDTAPPAGSVVLQATAQTALDRYRPAVVLGCFVPSDAGVDEAVLTCPSVRHYLVLGARVGGEFGSARLWRTAGWTWRPIAEVSRWMLTRHDAWTGEPGWPLLQHGEAWCFSRS